MTKRDTAAFGKKLKELARRIQGTAESSEEQARSATSGESSGSLSNAPLHLGDMGSAELAQELGATLLENEQYLQGEISAALNRIDKGTFGICENCQARIDRQRLDAIPYARYCVACAAKLHAGREVNLNEGRPASWAQGIGLRSEGPPPGVAGEPPESMAGQEDRHAAGTPGGGSAVGGLAGTNVGHGGPDDADLEEAMGSSAYDASIESQSVQAKPLTDVQETAYSGRAGGSVGGTPANKRAPGGKSGRPRR